MTGRARLSLIAVLCAMAMVVLDAGMLNIALPSLSRAMNVDLARSIWAVSSYQLALLAGLLPAAQLAERYGQRAVFGIGLTAYLLASILSATSTDLATLIAGRLCQGLGGAVIMALGIAVLRNALGPDKLARAIGWNAMVVAMSAAAAPALAAAILSLATWPWLFLAKLPLGLVALAATAAFPAGHATRTSLDWTGMAAHTVLAVVVFITFERMTDQPLTSIGLLTAAILLIRWMVSRQASEDAPLWPIDLMTNNLFRNSSLASVACFTGQTAGLVALPLALQVGSGFDVSDAALIMTCWPVSVAIMAPVSGRLAERFGSPILCATGGTLLSIGLLTTGLAPWVGGIGIYIVSTLICGIGFGLFQVPNNRSLFLSAPIHRAAAAGGIQGSARLMGQSLGALVVGAFLAHHSAADAATAAVLVGAFCASAASLVSLTNLQHSVADGHPLASSSKSGDSDERLVRLLHQPVDRYRSVG